MKRNIVILIAVLSLVAGLAGGYLFGQSRVEETKDDHHSEDSHSHGSSSEHEHKTLEAPEGQAPTVKLHVVEDSKSGWHVRMETTNFRFTPENANEDDVLGEGHAHLYVDGKLVSRLYGHDFHYNQNFDGTKTFKVTLNGNSHADYTVGGQVVSDEVEVHHQH